MQAFDVIIVGAGAAGLMCAIESGRRKRKVLVLDHANKPGKKILMSGGGRCNFTNYYIDPEKYISHNPHFAKSALSRFTQWDFIERVKKHRISFHEKTLGQLFCDEKAQVIVDMLLAECAEAQVKIALQKPILEIKKNEHFIIRTAQETYSASSLVIATGGLSIPTMGASPFAYKIAEQFGIKVWPTRAGLVPFTLDVKDKELFAPLSGVSVDTLCQNKRISFRENILFTHRGLSGPAILQISSYWLPGEHIELNLLPDMNLVSYLKEAREQHPHKQLHTLLTQLLPKRLIDIVIMDLRDRKMAEYANRDFEEIAQKIHHWSLRPNGTEGYRTAEVTLGGIDCDALSSKTMATHAVPNLYFIGEAVDVTGWLGGYNFQWAWSSGWAAGQVA